MCFNRRRNIFTLGDFHQNTNPISQLRTQYKNRQQADVFESDPFKVQSYNFRYAERPSIPKATQYKTCRFHTPFQTFNQQQQQQQPQTQFQNQTQHQLLQTEPLTDTYYYNYDFVNSGLDENAAQADQLSNFRGYENSESQAPLSSSNVFCNQSKGSLASRQQTGTYHQQCQHIFPRTSYSSTNSHQKLSSYARTLPQTTTTTRPPNTSSTTGMPFKIKTHSSNIQREFEPGSRSTYTQYVQNEIQKISPTVRRLTSGCSSKAVAAAVGTVGPNTKAPPPTTPSIAAATAAIKRLNERALSGSLTTLESKRRSLGSRRLNNIKENYRSNNSIQRTGRSCSSTVLKERTENNPSQQSMQNGTTTQTLQQLLQNISKRNLVRSDYQPPPYCPIHNPTPPTAKNYDCQISINIKKLEKQPNDKVIIRIESAAPFKVVNNNNASDAANKPASSGNNFTNMRCKRLNNLMSGKTIKNPPRNYNIVSKSSAATINSNLRQSNHSLSEEDNTYSQRKRACESFFDREDERLRELESRSPIHTPVAATISKERLPTRLPWTTEKNKNLTSKTLTSQRLQHMYNNKLSSLTQLHATTSKPTSRTPSVQSRRSSVVEDVQVPRNSSTTTFTLGKSNSRHALGAASTSSTHSMISNCSRNSTVSLKSISKPKSSMPKISDAIPKSPMNVNINLFTERLSSLRV